MQIGQPDIVTGMRSQEETYRHFSQAASGTSELACALICTAFVDDAITRVLRAAFVVGNTSKQALKDGGIVGSLMSRAKMAYLMGLIDSKLLTAIRSICEVRNNFAHRADPVGFESPEIVKLCDGLKNSVGGVEFANGFGLSPLTDVTFKKSGVPARDEFVWAVNLICWGLRCVETMVSPENAPAVKAVDLKTAREKMWGANEPKSPPEPPPTRSSPESPA